MKHGGGSHMLQGCSTLTVTGNLTIADSRMYGAKYMPKQEENLLGLGTGMEIRVQEQTLNIHLGL